MLESFELVSETANNGQQALDLVKQRLRNNKKMYKLIIMDYSMPVMDGPTACKEILEELQKYVT